jgi:hypothetical protein
MFANLAPSAALERYRRAAPLPALSYATVRDYCDSADAFGDLARHQNDLKDVQRPWAVKAVLNRVAPRARLLEIGSGEPLAASVLASLGYKVTVCDPFDGSGNGPTEYSEFRKKYQSVAFIRAAFLPDIGRSLAGQFDCIFSISVLEHIPRAQLADVFQATALALKPGGVSLHAVDHVLEGQGDAMHEAQLREVLRLQHQLAGSAWDETAVDQQLQELLIGARQDLETFFLSPQGHNLWRGCQSYDAFPFRKCISVQTIVRRPEKVRLR